MAWVKWRKVPDRILVSAVPAIHGERCLHRQRHVTGGSSSPRQQPIPAAAGYIFLMKSLELLVLAQQHSRRLTAGLGALSCWHWRHSGRRRAADARSRGQARAAGDRNGLSHACPADSPGCRARRFRALTTATRRAATTWSRACSRLGVRDSEATAFPAAIRRPVACCSTAKRASWCRPAPTTRAG